MPLGTNCSSVHPLEGTWESRDKSKYKTKLKIWTRNYRPKVLHTHTHTHTHTSGTLLNKVSLLKYSHQFSSVQSLSRVRLCDPMNRSTPGLSVHHQLPEFTQTSIESVMPSSHLILCRPLLLLPPIPPSIRVFQWVNSSHEVAKVLEFQLQHHFLNFKVLTRLSID